MWFFSFKLQVIAVISGMETIAVIFTIPYSIALLRMVAPGTGFRGVTLFQFRNRWRTKKGLRCKVVDFRSKNRWRQKKGLRLKTMLSVQMKLETKQNEKTRSSPQISGAGPPRGGKGSTMILGPMDFREPMKGPMGFRKAVGFSGPSRGPMSLKRTHQNDTEKSACEAWRPFFFHGNHLISTGKTVTISVKTFFLEITS